MEILYLFTGTIIGALIAWLIFKLITGNLTQKLQFTEQQFNEVKQSFAVQEKTIIDLNRQISAREAELRHTHDKLTQYKQDVEQLQEKFRLEFKNLANDILEEKTKKFTEQNKTNLDQVLKPLQEKISDFQKQVKDNLSEETKQRSTLQEQLRHLTELNRRVGDEARALTTALKGETKTQGNWGEIILESILEKSGLVKDREYKVQESFTTSDGRRQQPDVIVYYPGERCIIIDSKVSLTAYERYVNATDEAERVDSLKEHLLSVRQHISGLSQKNYPDLVKNKSLDFVMLFMAVEPAYLLAMQSEPELWNNAYQKRVLLISPTNLIAALKLIESMWKQEFQNRNAQQIAEKAGDMYDKFQGFVQDLISIGRQMDSAKKNYEEAMNKLYSGKGNLVRRAEELRELGVKSRKDLPPTLLDRAGA